MPSDWKTSFADVTLAAGTTPKVFFNITANANCDIIVRKLMVAFVDANTSNVNVRVLRATGTASGGSAATFVNVASGSSETARFSALRATGSNISGLTASSVYSVRSVASNYGVDIIAADEGLNRPGIVLRGGETLMLEITGATSHTVSAAYVEVAVSQ